MKRFRLFAILLIITSMLFGCSGNNVTPTESPTDIIKATEHYTTPALTETTTAPTQTIQPTTATSVNNTPTPTMSASTTTPVITVTTPKQSTKTTTKTTKTPQPTPKVTMPPNPNKVRNVIFFIGDGMGCNHLEATRILKLGKGEKFHMETMHEVKNGITTHNADYGVTDSAAAATALATGFKTKNYMLGLNADGKPVQTILEKAQAEGKHTGLVTTKYITDATPAAFVSHIESREENADIAETLLAGGTNVILGGYNVQLRKVQYSYPQYSFIRTRDELKEFQGDYIVGMFSSGNMDKAQGDEYSPTLAEMTEKALEILDKNYTGFFLMVEGGVIDTASHERNMVKMTDHVKAFDDAIKVALDFQKKNPDTLIIVTADHETGGVVIPPNAKKEDLDDECFKTRQPDNGGAHTSADVPFFVKGRFEQEFYNVRDNTDIPKKIAKVFGFTDFPKILG